MSEAGSKVRAESTPLAKVRVEAIGRALLDGVLEAPSQQAGGREERVRVDLGLVTVFADERPLQGLAGLMDWRRSGRLSSLFRGGFCTGAAGERVLMPGSAGLPIDRLVLIGLGPRAHFDGEAAQRIAADLVDTARSLGVARVLVALPSSGDRRPAELLFAAFTQALESTPSTPPAPTPHPPSASEAEDSAEPPLDELAPASSSSGSDAASALAVEAQPEAGVEERASPAPSAAGLASPEPIEWWVVAEERVVARLRRVLSGPPRATPAGAHT